MELRQLEYLVAIVDEGGFARAADRLHIVQSAVSQQIRRLERELGFTVFDRSHRQVRLTPAGEAFLPYAQAVIAATTAARDVATTLLAEGHNVLRIGTSEGLGEHLEAILALVTDRRPDIRIDLVAAHSAAKLAALRAGDLDAAFIRAPGDTAGLSVLELWDAELVVALPATHPAAAHPVVELADLADLPAALAPADTAAGVAELIRKACADAGFGTKPGPPFTNLQDLLAGPIATGRCWTLLYADVATRIPTRRIAFRPTDPAITIPTALVARVPATPLVAALRSAARAYAASVAGSHDRPPRSIG
ncbi:LysR family transcriptional regulator [Nocardia sp. NBC_00511]|uniref:LysR family transcriptional regulator n=1 Tax=Nocardia sp. NBC_00511 TaxID=2903591 RepID=UPI002F917F3B